MSLCLEEFVEEKEADNFKALTLNIVSKDFKPNWFLPMWVTTSFKHSTDTLSHRKVDMVNLLAKNEQQSSLDSCSAPGGYTQLLHS